MEITALTLEVIGTVMIAFIALRVHHRFWKEHKIDESVFKSMKREQITGAIGIVFVIIGFLLELTIKLQIF